MSSEGPLNPKYQGKNIAHGHNPVATYVALALVSLSVGYYAGTLSPARTSSQSPGSGESNSDGLTEDKSLIAEECKMVSLLSGP